MTTFSEKLKSKGEQMSAEIYDINTRKEVNGRMTKMGGKAMSGIGSAMGKVASGLSNPLVQIGLQVGMAAINKSIEIYQAEMEKARKAGNAAFAEPTETAKWEGLSIDVEFSWEKAEKLKSPK